MEMQSWGFVARQVDAKLRRLTNKRLIESTERITFEEDEAGLFGDIPFAFRITSIGVYHVRRWAGIFAYLDAVLFDTPIFSSERVDQILADLEDFSIAKRFERTKVFRNYLSESWYGSDLSPSYFDWPGVVSRGNENFERVGRAIVRDEKNGRSKRRRAVRR